MFSVKRLQEGLNTEFLGREVKYLEKTYSTNVDAWECSQTQKQEGALIIADHQTKGRGRRQSKWYSVEGKSLTFSFMLLPEIALEKLGILPLLAGVSIVKGIHNISNILSGLKWPNDIMIRRKKMGGILIESRTVKQGLSVVVGIGLNINESEDDIPDKLQGQATSLHIESGEKFTRELLLSSILNEFENLYLNFWHDIIPLWQEYCIHENDDITFYSNKKVHQDIFQGVTETGHAMIQIDGETKTFPAGMVTL